MKAFILISLHDRTEKKLQMDLKKYPQVKNAYILFGEWDVLAEVEMSGPEELGTFVMDKVRAREDVKLTSSLIVAA